MELRHLRYFLAVAEDLSFRGAAARLHLSQPALSAQIKALEDELKVRLLQRTTRSVALTHAGRVFLEEARAVLNSASQAEQRARTAEQGLTGTLRVGLIASIATVWLARILRNFLRQFPGVQLSLYDLPSPEQMRRLREGELDAALLRPPVGFPEMEYTYVGEASQVLAASSRHRLARKRGALTWKDFDGEALVMMHPNMQHGFYDPFLAECSKAGAKPYAAQYANDIQTLLWLISAGFGIAPTTATLAEMKRPGLVFRALPPGLPPVQTVLAWRRNEVSPVLANFLASFKDSAAAGESFKSGKK
jgi:DNA-binding transcriptional LysR family regulator